MKVEIWSDLICPWCGLGQHRLELALAAFEHAEHVQVVHRSFQLDPGAPQEPVSVARMLAKKGLPPSQVSAMTRRVEALAAADGLSPYVVGNNVTGNTRLAHELLALASERGLESTAWKHLYRAYFGEQRSIFDVDSLVELAAELGLDPDEARVALKEGRYRSRVEADGEEARALGCSGVPFVVLDRRFAVSGAQSVDVFLRALQQAWGDRPVPLVTSSEAVCGPEGCALPGE